MDLIKLIIRGISYSQTQVGAYALILEEQIGDKKLPIIIGNFEAQAIAVALEKDIKPPRPLTHDLFLSLADNLSLSMKSVVIYKLEEGIFHSNIIFESIDGQLFEIDARTSDAIALAVRFDAPIYAMKHVMDKAGISMTIIPEEDSNEVDDAIEEIKEELKIDDFIERTSLWEDYDENQLNDMMNKAVESEDYELAAKLRDEIEKRKNEK